MDRSLMADPGGQNRMAEIRTLLDCNEKTEHYGLRLSEAQITALELRRNRALQNTGRVEFGGGILKQLILVFCDSPYLLQKDYEETLSELQDIFYFLKNETRDRIPDDELLAAMRRVFDGRAGGSLEQIAEFTLDALSHPDDPEDSDWDD